MKVGIAGVVASLALAACGSSHPSAALTACVKKGASVAACRCLIGKDGASAVLRADRGGTPTAKLVNDAFACASA